MKNILVVCTGNSCRSQMAEACLRHFTGGAARVASAGIEAHGVNPTAIRVMREDHIDICSHRSKTVKASQHDSFDFVITVCDNARECCPHFSSSAKKFHRDFPDPSRMIESHEQVLERLRQVREDIKIYCKKFVAENL